MAVDREKERRGRNEWRVGLAGLGIVGILGLCAAVPERMRARAEGLLEFCNRGGVTGGWEVLWDEKCFRSGSNKMYASLEMLGIVGVMVGEYGWMDDGAQVYDVPPQARTVWKKGEERWGKERERTFWLGKWIEVEVREMQTGVGGGDYELVVERRLTIDGREIFRVGR